MNEYEQVLGAYRAEIAAIEARAQTLREELSPIETQEARQREASTLDATARQLRLSLPERMRTAFDGSPDDGDELLATP